MSILDRLKPDTDPGQPDDDDRPSPDDETVDREGHHERPDEASDEARSDEARPEETPSDEANPEDVAVALPAVEGELAEGSATVQLDVQPDEDHVDGHADAADAPIAGPPAPAVPTAVPLLPHRPPPSGARGMRIRRLRLPSVAKIAGTFWVLAYLTLLATLVALWNAALSLGFIDEIEALATISLGLQSFDLVGQDLFDVAVFGLGLLTVLGFVLTLLLAIVYNATCQFFGGLAVETGPLRRRRRVFSLRHRRFIDVV
jgi:hypothetical protein